MKTIREEYVYEVSTVKKVNLYDKEKYEFDQIDKYLPGEGILRLKYPYDNIIEIEDKYYAKHPNAEIHVVRGSMYEWNYGYISITAIFHVLPLADLSKIKKNTPVMNIRFKLEDGYGVGVFLTEDSQLIYDGRYGRHSQIKDGSTSSLFTGEASKFKELRDLLDWNYYGEPETNPKKVETLEKIKSIVDTIEGYRCNFNHNGWHHINGQNHICFSFKSDEEVKMHTVGGSIVSYNDMSVDRLIMELPNMCIKR